MSEQPSQIASVSERAYRAIRNDIIFAKLKPGERLRLEPIRKQYGISVTTLREILNRLTSEGFVAAEGRKGFEVAPISDADLAELAELRILLENHALRRSFEAGDLDWEARVVAAHHKLNVMETRMIAGDASLREAWKRADWEFHRALIQACGSRQILETHGAVFDKYLRYQMITLTFRGEATVKDHRDLADAALARDADKASEVLARHIRNGVEHSIAGRNAEVAPRPSHAIRRIV